MKERTLNDVSFFLKEHMSIKCFDLHKGQSTPNKLKPKKNYEFKFKKKTGHLDIFNP